MITIAIQAGGRSSRMGRDKAHIPLGGKPIIEHLLQRVDGLADEILVTTNNPQAYEYLGLPMVSDIETPGGGALNGLYTALFYAHGETILVLACDMPFVNRPLLAHMLQHSSQADIVVPHHAGGFEPLHAVYRKRSCLPAIETALAQGEKRMISFFPSVDVLSIKSIDLSRLDPDGLSFFNVNTPEDLAKAEELIKKA